MGSAGGISVAAGRLYDGTFGLCALKDEWETWQKEGRVEERREEGPFPLWS